MTRNITRLALTATLLSVFAGPAHSAFIYDEGVSGDINNGSFAFSDGINLIHGSMGFTWADGFQAVDFDNFGFQVPTGYEMTAAVFSWFDLHVTAAPGVALMGIGRCTLRDGNQFGPVLSSIGANTGTDFCMNALDGPGSSAFSVGLPFDAGNYGWNHGVIISGQLSNCNSDAPCRAAWDYTLSFNLRSLAVSEPNSLSLTSLGLLGLAFSRRRRSSLAPNS